MVMELLGANLESIFLQSNRQFSARATTQMAIQMLDIISYVHSRQMIVRNIKPENFCLGHPGSPQANFVYLIGLNHATSYITESGEHIEQRPLDHATSTESNIVCATPRYMSLHGHKGCVLSRRDDLESMGYMFVYFMLGKLPWQGLVCTSEFEKYSRIYLIKKSLPLDELCTRLPVEYYHFLLYSRTLRFEQEPNYRYLSKMFSMLLARIKLKQAKGSVIQRTQTSNGKKSVSFAREREEIDFEWNSFDGQDLISRQRT